ncbi:MAG: hypothetical protein U9Q38_03970 [Thermodesulfobacteriota bacterium]|nr:hypothetical protein [Thermodesulfobacteriota bacterium]
MITKYFIKILLLVVVILCLGCQAFEPIKRLQESSDPYHGSSYKSEFDKWTRKARIYMGLDVKLIASATFKSSQFRDAYSTEYVRIHRLIGAEKEKFVKDQREAAAAYNDFVLAAYVPDKKWNDFSKKDSIWKIYLTVGESKRLKPVEIRKIKKINAVTGHFYPFISPWKSVYLVRFPADDKTIVDGRALDIKLIIISVFGSAEMVWNKK